MNKINCYLLILSGLFFQVNSSYAQNTAFNTNKATAKIVSSCQYMPIQFLLESMIQPLQVVHTQQEVLV